MSEKQELEVKIGALILDPHNGTPIVVLKSLTTEQVLPIWVGSFEANAITSEIEKHGSSRPMTHDLIRNLFVISGFVLSRVVVTELVENTFYAKLYIVGSEGKMLCMDSRPSDAVALAMRFDCPIFVREELFANTRSSITEDSFSDGPSLEDPDSGKFNEGEEWPDLIG